MQIVDKELSQGSHFGYAHTETSIGSLPAVLLQTPFKDVGRTYVQVIYMMPIMAELVFLELFSARYEITGNTSAFNGPVTIRSMAATLPATHVQLPLGESPEHLHAFIDFHLFMVQIRPSCCTNQRLVIFYSLSGYMSDTLYSLNNCGMSLVISSQLILLPRQTRIPALKTREASSISLSDSSELSSQRSGRKASGSGKTSGSL